MTGGYELPSTGIGQPLNHGVISPVLVSSHLQNVVAFLIYSDHMSFDLFI